ncbi:hypothetical protein A0O36_01630 [Piscirickettsiaceae bacterium NZ-RLO1]|nr:hypothetical protein A0O36_01630 [Piscirickettsiaceae bacterium NZ-RLO1]
MPCDEGSRGFIVVAFCSAILHHWMCKIPTEVATLTNSHPLSCLCKEQGLHSFFEASGRTATWQGALSHIKENISERLYNPLRGSSLGIN